jgi:hypothetical protein
MGLNKAFYEEQQPDITDEDVEYMLYMLEQSSYDIRQREFLFAQIKNETDPNELERLKQDLYNNNLGIHSAVNPNQKEINKHLKNFI